MAIHEQLQTVIQQIVEAKAEYDRLAFDEEQPHELGSPASPKQIAKLEAILARPLPASYRAFLELHNGWGDFYAGAKLLAVEDHESEWVKEKLEFWNELWDPDSDDPFEHGAIPILLGESENCFLVLDPRKMRDDGNMDFVLYDYMQAEEHYEDFLSYLEHELDVIRGLIDKETKGTDDGETREGEE